jgi:hypothetical protein
MSTVSQQLLSQNSLGVENFSLLADFPPIARDPGGQDTDYRLRLREYFSDGKMLPPGALKLTAFFCEVTNCSRPFTARSEPKYSDFSKSWKRIAVQMGD